MLICAALLVQVDGISHPITLPCVRHGDGYKTLKALGYAPKTKYKVLEEGFIDNSGIFYNRKSALEYAKVVGQLSQSTIYYKEDTKQEELYSEDLY